MLFFVDFLTLKMEALRSSETSLTVRQSTQNTLIFKSISVWEHVRELENQNYEPECIITERTCNGMIKVAAVVTVNLMNVAVECQE